MAEDTRFLVIGAGISGLCAAFYLAREHGAESVRVLEADHAPGGTARTNGEGGFHCEWGPNGFLDKEPLTLQWIADLGLSGRILRANAAASRRFLVRHGRLVEVKPPPAFLFSPLLSLRGRLRLLCEPFIRPGGGDQPESIWHFAARRIGREAADLLVAPMVTGVFAGDARQLSLKHCFPRLAELEREYGSLFKALRAMRASGQRALGPGGVLTSLDEGMGLLTRTAAEALGDRLLRRSRVASVAHDGTAFRTRTADGLEIQSENVVVAAPAHAAADFLAPLDRRLDSALRGIAYADVAVVCTGYRRERVRHALDGFGFLIPRVEGRRALGSLWSSSIFANRAPEGYVLMRTMFGGYLDPEAAALSDAALARLVREEVHPLTGIAGEPDFVRIFRHRPGIPQYLLGHGTRLSTIEAAEERHPGLVFAGNAYRGVGVNDCVASAHRAVQLLRARAAH